MIPGDLLRPATLRQMPLFTRPMTDERDGLLTSLAQQRDGLLALVAGLTEEQARATPTASDLSLGGLVKHCLRTERRWLVAGIAGEPLPGLWPIENWEQDFELSGEETLKELVSSYSQVDEQTRRIIAGVADLGQPTTLDPDTSVRWVLLHLIKETARHSGQADLIRETLDGQRAGALTDAYDREERGSGPVA